MSQIGAEPGSPKEGEPSGASTVVPDAPPKGRQGPLRSVGEWAVVLACGGGLVLIENFAASLLSPFAARTLVALASGLPILVIGYFSRSSLWSLVIWIGPMLIVLAAFVLGAHGVVFSALLFIVLAWTIWLMFSIQGGEWVDRATGGAFAWVTALGMSPTDREAYTAWRRAHHWEPEEIRDASQLEDISRTAHALRARAKRVLAVAPPDDEWSSVIMSDGGPELEYADHLEAGEPVDYEELDRRSKASRREFRGLLRERSWTYRVIAWIPRGPEETED